MIRGIVINKQRGKYVKKNIVEPVGVCDYSGFFFSKSDLVKQREWRGNDLVWTGFFVGKPFLDEPNEQNRPPLIKGDPKAVKNPRPMGIFTPEGENAVGNNSSNILNNINFNVTEEELLQEKNLNLPDFAGEDISQISADERLKLLQSG